MLCLTIITSFAKGQNYPSYGPEKKVTITGLDFDAMEPFISPNDNYLFFNNLNNGTTTKLYYATKVNDSTFNFVGELNGTNQTTPPYLDAVPDIDNLNNFYWTSTRGYPANYHNLHVGKFNNGNVTNIKRIYGDFYIYSPNWIIMYHGISYDGQYLYYNNAKFDESGSEIYETRIGLAQKVNDTTFAKLYNSDILLQTVNDNNYIYYAPFITKDNLELYYTRFPKGEITVNTLVEICVVVRNTSSDNFSSPKVLFSEPVTSIIEAPTLTTNMQIMYYHKKIEGVHKIMMRYRQAATNITYKKEPQHNITIAPNPMNNSTVVKFDNKLSEPYTLTIIDNIGQKVRAYNNISASQLEIYKETLKSGLYLIQICIRETIVVNQKLIVK